MLGIEYFLSKTGGMLNARGKGRKVLALVLFTVFLSGVVSGYLFLNTICSILKDVGC
jgi:hypothetical protein